MDRKGKPSHRPKRRPSDYYIVLVFYAANIPDGREITLGRVSKFFKVSPQSVPNLVTKARKLARNGELVFKLPYWVNKVHRL